MVCESPLGWNSRSSTRLCKSRIRNCFSVAETAHKMSWGAGEGIDRLVTIAFLTQPLTSEESKNEQGGQSVSPLLLCGVMLSLSCCWWKLIWMLLLLCGGCGMGVSNCTREKCATWTSSNFNSVPDAVGLWTCFQRPKMWADFWHHCLQKTQSFSLLPRSYTLNQLITRQSMTNWNTLTKRLVHLLSGGKTNTETGLSWHLST